MMNEQVHTPEEEIVEEQEVQEEQPDNSTPPPKKASSKDENMARMRAKLEQLERERDELAAERKKEEEDDFTMGADDLVEGKHLKSYHKEIKNLRKQLEETKTYMEQVTLESRLKTQYPDFSDIVTTENIKWLQEMHPDVAESISGDMFQRARTAYTFIKKLKTPDEYASERSRAVSNNTKPRPLASINSQQGDSPLSHANAFSQGLTKELKEQLWKEMQETRKNY